MAFNILTKLKMKRKLSSVFFYISNWKVGILNRRIGLSFKNLIKNVFPRIKDLQAK